MFRYFLYALAIVAVIAAVFILPEHLMKLKWSHSFDDEIKGVYVWDLEGGKGIIANSKNRVYALGGEEEVLFVTEIIDDRITYDGVKCNDTTDIDISQRYFPCCFLNSSCTYSEAVLKHFFGNDVCPIIIGTEVRFKSRECKCRYEFGCSAIYFTVDNQGKLKSVDDREGYWEEYRNGVNYIHINKTHNTKIGVCISVRYEFDKDAEFNDLDNDGKQEIIILNHATNSINVYESNQLLILLVKLKYYLKTRQSVLWKIALFIFVIVVFLALLSRKLRQPG